MVLLHGWLLLLTLAVLAMAVACLKYCATNRVKADYDIYFLISITTMPFMYPHKSFPVLTCVDVTNNINKFTKTQLNANANKYRKE